MGWFNSEKDDQSIIKQANNVQRTKDMEAPMLKKDDKNASGNDEVMAFLGQGTEFKGVITYDGTIRVDGRIEGEIITKGTLIIGQNANIEAQINAGTVISAGKITGNIHATKKVQLQAPAILNGSIKAPVVTMDEGVIFNGQCEMDNTKLASKGSNAKPQVKEAAIASKSA